MVTAVVYGKENCGICKSAGDKLALLNVPFTKVDIDKATEFHDGWQADNSVEVLATLCMQNRNLPVIKLDFGDGDVKFLSYPDAMALLKERIGRKSQAKGN